MKTLFLAILLTIIAASLSFAQHIPQCQGNYHSTSICYGYATARAFDRTWSDSRCPAGTLHLTGINTAYFDWYEGSSLSGITYHDIVAFGGHAAFVVGLNPITVDQVPNENGAEQQGVSLSTVIYDQHQGQPTGYYRKKPLWRIALKNSFHGGDSTGTIGFNGQEPNSPYTSPLLHWESTQNIDGVMHGRTYGDYVQLFNNWRKYASVLSYEKSTSTTVDTYIFSQPLLHTAFFDRQFNITFQNSFPGTTGGQIKVNDTTRSSGFVGHAREQTPTQGITGEALYQVIENIEYTFTSWSPGSSTYAGTTFYPTDNATYTANFTAKPQPPTSLSQVASIGQNVHLTWTDNPNTTRVTQYHIYRSCEGGEERNLVATAYKGLQSWTDPDVTVKGTKDGPLITYDVCGVDSVTSNEGYSASVSQYGYYVPRIVQPEEPKAWNESAEMPTEFSVGNYPNPFNPSTTISYSLPNNSSVKLDIYDVAGRKVRNLLDESKSAGYHNVVWNGRDENGREVASGIYLYQFTATPINGEKAFTQSGKLVLMK